MSPLEDRVDGRLVQVEGWAWRALAQGRFSEFGHLAGHWEQLNCLLPQRHVSPFGPMIELGTAMTKGHQEGG